MKGLPWLVVLALAGNAYSVAYWSDAGSDPLWSNPDNWTAASSYRPPASSDSTYVRFSDMVSGGQGPIIQAGMDAVARNLSIEVGTGSLVEIAMTGGSLTLYYPGATNCYFRLGAGTSSGKAVFTMSGGLVTIRQDNGSEGGFRVGSGYRGELYMSGNAVIEALQLVIALADISPGGLVDLRDNAKIVLVGDHIVAVQGYIDAGVLTGYGLPDNIRYDYDIANPGKTTVWTEWADPESVTQSPMGHAVPNPVIYKLADSGIMKHNGEYYIIGTGSSGDMRKSDNLVNWGPRVHVFSMNNSWATGEAGEDDEIHACDIQYIDGIFHLYWSVNRADIGVRHIGHAIAQDDPMNFYTEPVTSTYFADYIDAHLFRDNDGSCYFYTVKFPHGNTVYGQGMADPWTRTGTDYKLLWLPSTNYPAWEWVSSERVNEAPFVIHYRGRYYILYNANATWNPNYSIGCAVSDSPLGFTNDDKYLTPVLELAARGGHSITHIGQPGIVRGPNGFEWWLIYFAMYDASSKSQAVDRILFFDRTVSVMGPSCNLKDYSEGTYTPPPAAPTLGDLFNEGTTLEDYWDVLSGTWDINDGQARQIEPAGEHNQAIIKSQPAEHYLVESGVKLMDAYPPGEKAGLTAYYKDPDNWMIIALDQEHGSWFYNKVEGGMSTVTGYPLPAGFEYTVYHTLCVTKNNTDFSVWIDGLPAPGNPIISTNFIEAGLPGLYTQMARACFDGFIYTIGWDEWDAGITGWGQAERGTPVSGTWQTESEGITCIEEEGIGRIFKGDLMEQYEFMTQITILSPVLPDGNPHQMGIYAVYTDESNWLKAVIDLFNSRLIVSGVYGGTGIESVDISLEAADSYNLRVIRREDGIRLFVNEQLKAAIPDVWSSSQVGLFRENASAVFNGITAFRLGSQYGDNPSENDPMSDNFDDGLFSPFWQQVSLHKQDITKEQHNTLPDIVIHESNGCLQFSGSEKGNDDTTWYGRGLKYNKPVYGNSIAEFDFHSLLAHATGVARAAIGLRIRKDLYNWFEVRQTDDQDGDKLEMVSCNNGVLNTSSTPLSNTSGTLRVKFDNLSGTLEYFLSEVYLGAVSMPGLKDSAYYVYITASTSNADNQISCIVDNFRIINNSADLNFDWDVNTLDFALFAQEWVRDDCTPQNDRCQGTDFDQDGLVNIDDLAELVLQWLKSI